MTPAPPPRILLVGMMGSGKSTVGRLLSHRLGWAYRDSDADVEAATGRTVPEIFELDGETAFRRAEAEALGRACQLDTPVVVSAAGGSVLARDNRRLLAQSGLVVWLRARPETNARRVGDGTGRPLLGDDPAEAMTRLVAQRAPFYGEVADLVIDVDRLSPKEVVARILEVVGADGASARPRPRTRSEAPPAPTATA
ncbi:MAG TPA: shikimate kinase [Acidimicrobiales bacterium]